jgi:hypothetical protein
MKKSVALIALSTAFSAFPASAVIVAGASGGGNTANNTTRSQLESELATSFPAYENVVRYSDASGIYLGYNPATRDVWVLTARHITTGVGVGSAGSTITIDGLVYDRVADSLPGGDVRLVQYRRSDGAVPSLPAVSLSSTVPLANASLVVVGFGQNRVENAATAPNSSDAASIAVTGGTTPGYNWSGSSIKRWGTNNIEAEFLNGLEVGTPVSGTTGTFSIGGVDSVGFMTDFDQPGNGQWLSSNEAQGSLGDSGGSAFYFDGTRWVLGGLFSAVASFGGQTGNTSAFGNLSLITDVSAYSPAIQSTIGITLVPEPSVSLLALLSSVALFRRRR